MPTALKNLYTKSDGVKTMSLFTNSHASRNFFSKSDSPMTLHAAASCRINSSILLIARTIDPSNASVIFMISLNVLPLHQASMTSIKSQRKRSIESSTSIFNLHSNCCLNTFRAASFTLECALNTSSLTFIPCLLPPSFPPFPPVFSFQTRHETVATSMCNGNALKVPLKINSVATSSSAPANSHAHRPFEVTTPSSETYPSRLNTRRMRLSTSALIIPDATATSFLACLTIYSKRLFSPCFLSLPMGFSDVLKLWFFIIFESV
mmetsp:Transcript_5315/g.15597  ORF Transcript_5315/g.15597 Transcript_5315/m.15597 type:complete len:264 (+) Transcript_5315:83-874(+)